MENKLEQLLNSLIERGWLPFGEWCHRSPYKRVSVHKNYNKERTYVLFYSNNHSHWKVLRQVVSKESWLWQFVCENGMVSKQVWCYEEYHWAKCTAEEELIEHYSTYSVEYEYRLIESALCDEDKLEQFLLDNINNLILLYNSWQINCQFDKPPL